MINENELIFKHHFNNNPILPASLLLDKIMAYTGSFKPFCVYFYEPIVPPCHLVYKSTKNNLVVECKNKIVSKVKYLVKKRLKPYESIGEENFIWEKSIPLRDKVIWPVEKIYYNRNKDELFSVHENLYKFNKMNFVKSNPNETSLFCFLEAIGSSSLVLFKNKYPYFDIKDLYLIAKYKITHYKKSIMNSNSKYFSVVSLREINKSTFYWYGVVQNEYETLLEVEAISTKSGKNKI